jgi:hypothetical protein
MRINDTSPETQKMPELCLFDVTVLDTDAARYLDSRFYLRNRRPLIGAEVMLRKVLKAREDLAYDPGDPKLIDLALTTQWDERKIATPLSTGERRSIFREALKAAPYSADYWYEYGQSPGPDVDGIPSLGEPFFLNAIVYSNHSAYYAGYYANRKVLMYNKLVYARKQPGSQFAGMPTTDYHAEAEEVLCPFVRAARIYAAQSPKVPDRRNTAMSPSRKACGTPQLRPPKTSQAANLPLIFRSTRSCSRNRRSTGRSTMRGRRSEPLAGLCEPHRADPAPVDHALPGLRPFRARQYAQAGVRSGKEAKMKPLLIITGSAIVLTAFSATAEMAQSGVVPFSGEPNFTSGCMNAEASTVSLRCIQTAFRLMASRASVAQSAPRACRIRPRSAEDLVQLPPMS